MDKYFFQKLGRIIEFFLFEKIHYILILIFAFFVFFSLFKLIILPEIAIYKAKNIKNIQSSCLYLISEHASEQGRTKVVEIDGTKYHTNGHTLYYYFLFHDEKKKFPFYHKNKYYQGDSLFWDKIVINKHTCYEIKYIKVLDFIIIDFIYLYDFQIPKEFQSYEFQPIQLKKIN